MARFCCIDAASDSGQTLIKELAQAEDHARAARYRNPTKANASLAARCLLRTMLAEEFGIAPQKWTIRYDDTGRPWASSAEPKRLIFVSLSHSTSYAAAALSDTGTVGIDIETIMDNRPWPAISEKLFPDISPMLKNVQDFYRAWCLHEAWVKAHGGSIWDDTAHQSYFRLMQDLLTQKRTETIWDLTEFQPLTGVTGLCLSIGKPFPLTTSYSTTV